MLHRQDTRGSITYHNTLQVALAIVCDTTGSSLSLSPPSLYRSTYTHTLSLSYTYSWERHLRQPTVALAYNIMYTSQYVCHPKMQWSVYLSQHPVQFLGSDVPISIDVNLTKRLHQITHGGSLLPLHDEAELVVGHWSSTLRPVPLHSLIWWITTHALKCCNTEE
jgi:hypothetical protein